MKFSKKLWGKGSASPWSLVLCHILTLGLSGTSSRAERVLMPEKRYIVRLTAQEREVCRQTVRKLSGSSEKVRHAQILLQADADGVEGSGSTSMEHKHGEPVQTSLPLPFD